MDGFGCLKTVQSLHINIMGPHIKQNPFNQIQFARMLLNELVYHMQGNLCRFFNRIAVRAC